MKKATLLFAVAFILYVTLSCPTLSAQVPEWQWARSAGSSGYDYAQSVVSDEAGNCYVTGYFAGTITFDQAHTFISAGSSDFFVLKYDVNGNITWGFQVGGNDGDFSTSVAVDGSGNVFVAGYFKSASLTFGTTTLTNAGGNSYDIFLAKYDNDGNLAWAKSAGGTGDDRVNSVCADKNGNAYITGYFVSPTINFGAFPLANSGATDVFLAKYAPDGNAAWAVMGSGTGFDYSTGVATDPSGNVYITGYSNGSTLTFGPFVLTKKANNDIFLVKYTPVGVPLWAQNAGVSVDNMAYGIAVDTSGNCYVTGNFKGNTLVFGNTTLTNSGHADIFLAKYNALGVPMWAVSAGGTEEDGGRAVAVDKSQYCYLAGYYKSTEISFGSTVLPNVHNSTSDLFICEFTPGGDLVWARSVGSTADEFPYSITVDTSYYFSIAGYFSSPTVVFGNTTLVSNGTTDFMIARSSNMPPSAIPDAGKIGLSCYPNPAMVSITLKHPGNCTIMAYDMHGKLVRSIQDNNPETVVDLTGLPPGIYLFRASTREGTSMIKVIKQ